MCCSAGSLRLEGIGPDQLTIAPLVERVRNGQFTEMIMGTNPTLEGDGTALYIANQLTGLPVEITRLARGITTRERVGIRQ